MGAGKFHDFVVANTRTAHARPGGVGLAATSSDSEADRTMKEALTFSGDDARLDVDSGPGGGPGTNCGGIEGETYHPQRGGRFVLFSCAHGGSVDERG
jgi:hypothetical protein